MPEKLFESALEQTEDALKENGTSVSLTEKNYTDELNHMITSQSGITAMAWKSAKENLDALKQYKDGLLSYTDGVEKAGEGASKLQDGMDELKNGADEFIDEMDVNLANLQSFVTAEDNPRIGASADDQKINISAGLVFGVILIVLFAYVISVFTIHSIEKESSIIGTLYALGGARRELMHHYLMLACGGNDLCRYPWIFGSSQSGRNPCTDAGLPCVLFYAGNHSSSTGIFDSLRRIYAAGYGVCCQLYCDSKETFKNSSFTDAK